MEKIMNVDYRPLFKLTNFLIIIMLLIIPLQIIIFSLYPPPNTVEGFFELYKSNVFLGLLSLDFLYLINNTIMIILYLSLFVALYKDSPLTVLIAFILGIVGLVCYYGSNPSFEILNLSRKFFDANINDQIIYIAAGETLLAGYSGTSFNVYYVLNTICLLMFSYTLIKSPIFKKTVGYWALASGFFMIIPSSAGMIGLIFSLLSLIPWVVFIGLLRLEFKNKFSL
ncbi:hypothetical protein [Acetoanaerobium noterae]|uniref:hypothetical protein n=1 Tax=Acetoanaerobium noterae TaxID=745369 RepID=UPI0028ACE6EC|nr:hypothetical protein [Acetoanaerobium noterae]